MLQSQPSALGSPKRGEVKQGTRPAEFSNEFSPERRPASSYQFFALPGLGFKSWNAFRPAKSGSPDT